MAISDRLNTFAAATAIPVAVAANALLGDVIPLGSNNHLNDVDDTHLVILTDAAVTSAGAATVDFKLATDDNAAFASPTILASSGPIALAGLAAGVRVFTAPIPKGALSEAYLGVVVSVATAALTGGTVTAYLAQGGPGTWKSLPDGILPGTG